MPELPEVETIVRAVGPSLRGKRIARIECRYLPMLRPGLSAARRALVGCVVVGCRRRGKFIVIESRGRGGIADSPYLLIHLRMSGRLHVAQDGRAVRGRHERLVLRFDDGSELRFDDARKFGRAIVTIRPEEMLETLGVEPLAEEFTSGRLAALLHGRARMLKPLLLDQHVIAGLGNIYTDESLHRAGLNPRRRSDTLSPREVGRLHRAIRTALREAIRFQGTTIDAVYPGGRMQERLRAYGRAGSRCGRCRGVIRRIVVSQRGTFICSRCQPLRGNA